MAANPNPIFGLVPVSKVVTISAANANRDGTGTIVAGPTGGTNGTRIDLISIKAVVTTTAGMVRFYLDPATGTYQLWQEVLVTAITASATVAAFYAELIRGDGLPLKILPTNYIIGVSTEKAESMRIHFEGSDY